MELQHIVVHLVEKEQFQTSTILSLRSEELNTSDTNTSAKVVSLMDRIRALYNKKSGKAYGEFEPDSTFSFQLKNFDDGSTSFIDFSTQSMNDFKAKISLVPPATGGYMLFAKYKNNRENFFLVAMLKDTGGLSFDDNLDILDVNHLDLSNLHLAARINMSNWNLAGSKYISFIKGRSNADVRDYFKSFIGVTEFTESAENTKQLVAALDNYLVDKDLPNDKVTEIKERVYSYCVENDNYNQPAHLEDISRIVEDISRVVSPNITQDFLEFANSDEVQLSSEFYVDKPALRRLRRYYGRDKQVNISFEAQAYGTRVRFNRERNELTIYGIPEALKNQLPEE